MDSFRQDLRFALRSLARTPGFALAAVATLALGIGANTAVFSVVHAVLLRPLPFEAADRLVMVWGRHVTIGRETASLPDFLDWRRDARRFEGMAAVTQTRYNLAGDGEPEVIRGARATAALFPLLGVGATVGRVFVGDEERGGASRVVVLSDGFWRRRYGANPDVVGRSIQLSGVPHIVIGVAPPALRLQHDVDVWAPLVTDTTLGRRADFLTVIGRLRPGVTVPQAQEELSTIAARLEREYPESNSGWSAEVIGLQEDMVAGVRPALLVFMGAVGLVLLIACANVANLMLARITSREREVTIRAALGASRRRLARQLLTESIVLALAGGTVGLLLAVWGVQAVRLLEPGTLPRAAEVDLDLEVLGFAIGLALVTGLLFGLVPAWRVLGGDLHAGLKDGGRGTGASGVQRARAALVLAEVALAFMLLVGAALLLRSFERLQRVDPGFAGQGLLTARIAFPRNGYAEEERRVAFGTELLERLRATPGVRGAALVSDPPLGGNPPAWSFLIGGVEQPAPGVVQDALVHFASPDFFSLFGIPLLEGRAFSASDRAGAPPVALIGRALAERYWPGQSPLGQRITFGDPADSAAWLTIVGVVGDVRQETLAAPTHPQAYIPVAQFAPRTVVVGVRGEGDPLALLPTLKRRLAELDPALPLSEIATMDQVVAATLARPRLNAGLLGGFALAALLLATVGIYGVITYGVVQRTRELGIRMALGAGSARLLREVVSQGLLPVAAGLALGAVGALLGTRVLRSLLFGVGATDPLTFAGVTVVLLLVALIASYLPARRASRADPMVALRND
ncbi:MAG TPA: ABC transporter permease [Gemmatimonadales bacterium]